MKPSLFIGGIAFTRLNVLRRGLIEKNSPIEQNHFTDTTDALRQTFDVLEKERPESHENEVLQLPVSVGWICVRLRKSKRLPKATTGPTLRDPAIEGNWRHINRSGGAERPEGARKGRNTKDSTGARRTHARGSGTEIEGPLDPKHGNTSGYETPLSSVRNTKDRKLSFCPPMDSLA